MTSKIKEKDYNENATKGSSNSFNKNELVKYFPVIISVLYVIGFLVISLRLGEVGLKVKDFFTLDYLKAGILLILYFMPCILIAGAGDRISKKKRAIFGKLLVTVSSIVVALCYCLMIHTYVAKDLFTLDMPYIQLLVFSGLANMVYRLITNTDLNKNYSYIELGDKFFLLTLVLSSILIFGTQIYSEIKFEYGGGKPYAKCITIEEEFEGVSEFMREKEVLVYYENESWIHFKEGSFMVSIPKKIVRKEKRAIN